MVARRQTLSWGLVKDLELIFWSPLLKHMFVGEIHQGKTTTLMGVPRAVSPSCSCVPGFLAPIPRTSTEVLGSRGSGELLKIVTLDTASMKECFPGGSDRKQSACKAGDPGSIPGSGRSPGEGNGIPLQCAWLENSVNRGTWWATVHGVSKESNMTEHTGRDS